MAAIGIEVVDAAVIAVRDGERLAASPGIALLAPAGPVVGEAAAAAARLQPVLAADRFWSDLSQDAFAGGGGRPLSHADLVHAHLESLWRSIAAPGDEAVFAVPATMRPHQAGAPARASRARSASRSRASWMPRSRPARASRLARSCCTSTCSFTRRC